MKKYTTFFVCCLITLITAASVHAQFTGPGAQQAQAVTVSQANTLANKTPVILTGTIVQANGREKYTFRDSTGEIIIEIERKAWQGISVGPSDTVEISGKVEKELFRKRRIEVKTIRIL